jgi:hypothetical protein
MRSSVIIGVIGGIVIGSLQFISIMRSMGDHTGTLDMLLFYSPQIFYFMCLYMSIKIYARNQPTPIPEFKGCLKAGGITMVLIILGWFIGFFVALTHTDVNALVKANIANGRKADVPLILDNFTKQHMFDNAKLYTLPNILLGFAIIVLLTVITRLRAKKTA